MIGCWLVASTSDWLVLTELVARLRVRGQWGGGRAEAGGETENYGCNLAENKIQLISDHSRAHSDSDQVSPLTSHQRTLASGNPLIFTLTKLTSEPPVTTVESPASPQQWGERGVFELWLHSVVRYEHFDVVLFENCVALILFRLLFNQGCDPVGHLCLLIYLDKSFLDI